MGADLYLESLSDAAQKQWKPEFDRAVEAREQYAALNGGLLAVQDSPSYDALQGEVSRCYEGMYSSGYFRDSYNGTSVLATLGLSWWADVLPLLNKKSYMPVAKAKQFLKTVKGSTQELDRKSYGDWNEPWPDIQKYFIEKRARLEAFIEQAIKLKEPILMSL